ncbi:hypothetical protein [Acinetobacter stercoris]|uniref:Uncharacterized protein n=1 Tax=Acinetobacter stercoris TaxID=2126983 RepID=A0A2U3N2A8_9GAMM|nr:hypothetical protein [Acinetobacter stercoris]SPL71764.1 hypothetical protein KPC_2942 [Acinetobacter stercoris]
MTNIISAQEAISALQAGKNVLCRPAGGLLGFDELNQFPATVFFTNDHEFCIKRETTVLADIQFTKPVEPHDLELGQEIFIVMPTCILRTQYDHEHGDICLSVANGFAQLDVENAKLQLQAFGKTFGNMITEIEIKDGFNDKPKRTRASQKKAEPEQVTELKTESIDSPQHEFQSILDDLIDRALTAKTEIEVTKLYRYTVQWTDEQRKPLDDVINKRLTELRVKNSKYEIEFADLHAVVMHAKTPKEANDVIEKTQHWTEEQRKPLIVEISKKLAELNPPEKSESSLMVRVQKAESLEELQLLENEVQQINPEIQERMMSYVNQRRSDLVSDEEIKF